MSPSGVGPRAFLGNVGERLLDPERLEDVLGALLDRREDRAARKRSHAIELRKRAAETDERLKRLYDAIEAGVATSPTNH